MTTPAYVDAVQRFFAERNELIDQVGFIPVGVARQVAETTRRKAHKAAVYILSSNQLVNVATALALPGIGSTKAMIDHALLDPVMRSAIRELEDIEERVDRIYLPALEGLDAFDPMPEELRPLFYNVAGSRFRRRNGTETMFVSPDAVGWVIALDQYQEMLVVRQQLLGEFLRQFNATASDYAQRIADAGLNVAEGVSKNAGYLALAALAGVGLYAFNTFRKGNR